MQPWTNEFFHCYSKANESSEGNGYTGVRVKRVVQNLNRSGNGWIFNTMWITFPDVTNRWVELETAFGNGGEWNYTFDCNSTFCNYWKFATTQETAGEHIFKLTRETADFTKYDALIDGVQFGPLCRLTGHMGLAYRRGSSRTTSSPRFRRMPRTV